MSQTNVTDVTNAASGQSGLIAPDFRTAARFWFKLGWINFGGPAGQIAIMHDELVDKRRWVDEASFLHGLNYCMLLPGPEAMQLATWLGWRLHGLRGGIVAGVCFVLPAAFILAGLSWIYVRFGALPAVAGVLLGLQAAVLGIILQAVQRIGRRVLTTPFSMLLALGALLAIAVLGAPFPLIVLCAGLLGLLVWRVAPQWLPSMEDHAGAAAQRGVVAEAAPRLRSALLIAMVCVALWWLPLLGLRAWLGPDSTSSTMGMFFSKAALVTIGGAYAVLPYVAQQAVEVHGWLQPGQMLVGLGLAETTPGPLIMVLEFVGFVGGWTHPDLASPLLSALLCAAVTLWATFLPSFLFVLPAAPWVGRLREWPAANAALTGITAAVVGVILNLALWFGWRLLVQQDARSDVFVVAVAILSWLALSRWKLGVFPVVLVAALAGWIVTGMWTT